MTFGHRDTDGPGAVRVAADGVDPVADLRPLKDVTGQRYEQQPPDHGDRQRHAKDVELVREDGVQEVVAVHLVDVGARDRAGDQLGHAQVRTLQDEERAEGDQEAGDTGSHHEVPVDESHQQAEHQREDRSHDQVDAELVAEHRGKEPGGGNGDTGGQVELPTDHQHADTHGHDPDGGGLVEHREERVSRPERRRDDEEEDEDDDGGNQGADLGASEQAVGQTEGHSVRRLRRCRRRWGFGGMAHGLLRWLIREGWPARSRRPPLREVRTSGCCS